MSNVKGYVVQEAKSNCYLNHTKKRYVEHIALATRYIAIGDAYRSIADIFGNRYFNNSNNYKILEIEIRDVPKDKILTILKEGAQ